MRDLRRENLKKESTETGEKILVVSCTSLATAAMTSKENNDENFVFMGNDLLVHVQYIGTQDESFCRYNPRLLCYNMQTQHFFASPLMSSA